jgi:uncharacterized integral membrane protein
LIGILGIAVILVVVQNTAPFQGHFLWFTVEVPAVLLLVITAFGGFILGLLVPLLLKKEDKTYRIISR